MLNIMSGLVAPSQGSVKFDSVDMTAASPKQRNISAGVSVPGDLRQRAVAEKPRISALRNRKGSANRSTSVTNRGNAGHEWPAEQHASVWRPTPNQKISSHLVRPDVSDCCLTSR
jgi:glycerol transport system ATP-binding protein